MLFYTPHTWSHRWDPQHFPACWLENKPSPGPVVAGKSMFWATDQTDFEIAVNNSRVGFFWLFLPHVKVIDFNMRQMSCCCIYRLWKPVWLTLLASTHLVAASGSVQTSVMFWLFPEFWMVLLLCWLLHVYCKALGAYSHMFQIFFGCILWAWPDNRTFLHVGLWIPDNPWCLSRLPLTLTSQNCLEAEIWIIKQDKNLTLAMLTWSLSDVWLKPI